MSEAYNPETEIFEQLEALTLEARELAIKRDDAKTEEDRQVLERQLHEIERRVEHLKHRLRR